MADLMTGADSEGLLSEKLGDLVYNNLKNHWPDADPLATFTNLQIGMVAHKTTTDQLFHITSDSPGHDEVLQERSSHDANPRFNWLKLTIESADVSDPPTIAELNAIFGSPALLGEGGHCFLSDSSSGGKMLLILSDGSSYYYRAITEVVV